MRQRYCVGAGDTSASPGEPFPEDTRPQNTRSKGSSKSVGGVHKRTQAVGMRSQASEEIVK